jgi:hypothetical protein
MAQRHQFVEAIKRSTLAARDGGRNEVWGTEVGNRSIRPMRKAS